LNEIESDMGEKMGGKMGADKTRIGGRGEGEKRERRSL
jgi:hypothetical protein